MASEERAEDNVKSGLHEVGERLKAGGEAVKRAVSGDSMNPAEKLGSHLKEIGHDVNADVDRASRDA